MRGVAADRRLSIAEGKRFTELGRGEEGGRELQGDFVFWTSGANRPGQLRIQSRANTLSLGGVPSAKWTRLWYP
jgi:hypothetical protein